MQNISSDITNNDYSDISDLIKIREQYTNNLVLGYLNINSLKNKIINLREVVDKVLIDILCIDETKLDDTFPDAQFKINNYQYPPFRRDRNSNGGGKIVNIRQGLISKDFQSLNLKVLRPFVSSSLFPRRNGVSYLHIGLLT